MSKQLTSRSNPIMAEFRKDENGDVQAWCLALASLNESTAGSIQEVIIDALGCPRGPGWEDIHYRQSQRFVDHADRVLERLYRFSIMKEESNG